MAALFPERFRGGSGRLGRQAEFPHTMISIVKRVFEPSSLAQMRRKAEVDPTPRGTIEFCRHLARLGRREEARKLAQEGIARWPRCVDLRELLQGMFRHEVHEAFEDEHRQALASGAIEDWTRLIGVCLEHEELDAAIDLTGELLERHEEDVVAHRLVADLFARRLRRDHVREDAEMAMNHFERAIELDGSAVEPRIGLAELLLYVGAPGRAVLHLYEARKQEPEDEAIEELITRAQDLPLEQADIADLLRTLEEGDRPVGEPLLRDGAVPVARRDGWLQRISLFEGTARVMLLLGDDAYLAEDGFCRSASEERDEVLVTLGSSLRRTAQVSAKRMGIGAFHEAHLLWESGGVFATSAGATILLVELTVAQASDEVVQAARDVVASLASTVNHA